MRTFKDVPVGSRFTFASERDFPFNGAAKGPWVKISKGKYQHCEGGVPNRVGTIKAEVVKG